MLNGRRGINHVRDTLVGNLRRARAVVRRDIHLGAVVRALAHILAQVLLSRSCLLELPTHASVFNLKPSEILPSPAVDFFGVDVIESRVTIIASRVIVVAS